MSWNYEQHWRKKIAEYDAIRKAGNVEIRYKAKRIYVICPIDKEFVRQAKMLLGTYRKRTGIWTFSRRSEELILNLCYKIWPDKVTVKGQVEPILR